MSKVVLQPRPLSSRPEPRPKTPRSKRGFGIIIIGRGPRFWGMGCCFKIEMVSFGGADHFDGREFDPFSLIVE